MGMGANRGKDAKKTPRRNHVISRRAIREFCERNAGDVAAPAALYAWHDDIAGACWRQWADVRAMYPHADWVDDLVVFNVGGNKYRVVCQIHFDSALVLIRHVLTHTEYDKGKWKS
jgi:mRNA interferase HigB